MAPESIETIQQKLESAELIQDPSRKARLLNQLARLLAEDPAELMRAIAHSETALELASGQTPQDLDCLADCLESLGELYLQTTNPDLVVAYILKIRAFLDVYACTIMPETLDAEQAGKASFCARLLVLLGKTFTHLGEYGQAVEDYGQAQQVFHLTGNGVAEAAVQNSTGEVYIQLERYNEALQFLTSSLQTAQNVENKHPDEKVLLSAFVLQADILDNLCRTYLSLENLDKALESGLLSIQLFRQLSLYTDESRQGALQRGEARALINLGHLYMRIDAIRQDDSSQPGSSAPWSRALTTFQQAFDLTQDRVARLERISALLGLAEVHRRRREFDLALEQLNQAGELATGLNARREQYEVHRSLSMVYKETGDFAKALAHYEQFHTLRDQAFNQESARRLRNLELVHQVDTARKEAEISHLRNITLQNEIKERKLAEKSLTRANQLLKEEIEVKELLIGDLDDFAHMVAHDLKAPLTNMALSASLVHSLLGQLQPTLETNAMRRVQTEVMPSIDKITWMVGKMNRIINELLVAASVRSEDVQPVPLDMAAVVREAEKSLSYLIEEYQAEIQMPEAWPSALGHAPWVEEVWTNYISNAIVYGGRPPRIVLGADSFEAPPAENEPSQRFMRYWVQDNGQGVATGQQTRLFSKFGRIQEIPGEPVTDNLAPAAIPRSHGLGLSIVKRIVRRLGGTVGVESEGIAGEGSRFYFTLPAVPGE